MPAKTAFLNLAQATKHPPAAQYPFHPISCLFRLLRSGSRSAAACENCPLRSVRNNTGRGLLTPRQASLHTRGRVHFDDAMVRALSPAVGHAGGVIEPTYAFQFELADSDPANTGSILHKTGSSAIWTAETDQERPQTHHAHASPHLRAMTIHAENITTWLACQALNRLTLSSALKK